MEERQISTANQWRPSGGDGSGNGGSIHMTALAGIVNVNSLFTLAVFIGLAWNPSDPTNVTVPSCSAGEHVMESMVCFHVYSFSCFLFSSLVALCLKQIARAGRVNRVVLRAGILASAVGSVFGCGFLMLALVNLVQIKLGKIGCAGGATLGAVVPLVTLIPAAMFVYVGVIFYAFTRILADGRRVLKEKGKFAIKRAMQLFTLTKMTHAYERIFLCICRETEVKEFERVDSAGECGNVPADRMAFRMAPCASASQDVNAQVSASCCSAVQQIGKNPSCLCAVMLSNTAKSVGAKPEVAITIPKRCNLEDRPVGYKCGAYTLP